MHNEKHIRQFVIWRFFWTLLGISAAEFFMITFIIRILLPLLIRIGVSGKLMWLTIIIVIIAFLLAPFVIGAYSFTRGVTRELKISEEEFVNIQKENERRKYLLISDIAHDLKTPMTTVTGYAQALSDGMVKEDQQHEYLEAIRTKTFRMNEIINLLFDYTKLNSDGVTLNKTEVDICEELREIIASNYKDIEDAGDEIDIDIPEDKIPVSLDKLQMSRVFNNLLTNAVRHNGKGTKIKAVLRPDGDELKIFVADTGNVIPEDLAEKIFEPFVTGDESRQTKGGSGLGLSIVKKVTGLHGFRIKLTQKPDINRYRLGDEYNKAFLITIPVPD